MIILKIIKAILWGIFNRVCVAVGTSVLLVVGIISPDWMCKIVEDWVANEKLLDRDRANAAQQILKIKKYLEEKDEEESK